MLFEPVDFPPAPPDFEPDLLLLPEPALFDAPELDLPPEPVLFEDFEAVFDAPPSLSPDDFEAVLPPLFAPPVPDFEAAAPPALDLLAVEDAPLFAFEEDDDVLELLADFPPAVFDAPPDLAFAAPPDFAPLFSSLSTRPPTASAATFKAVNAAPVAAPTRISPATSLAVSRIGDESFFDDDFFVDDFDFDESALFEAPALLPVDFVEDAALFVDF